MGGDAESTRTDDDGGIRELAPSRNGQRRVRETDGTCLMGNPSGSLSSMRGGAERPTYDELRAHYEPDALDSLSATASWPPTTHVVERIALGRPLHVAIPWSILNLMVQYSRARLDASFGALSDATRRGVLEQLGRADASITDLAVEFHMTLTGMKKHVGVLDQAGLINAEKVGRVRTCQSGPGGLEEETA